MRKLFNFTWHLACSAGVFWTRECTYFRIRPPSWIWQLWRIGASKYFLRESVLIGKNGLGGGGGKGKIRLPADLVRLQNPYTRWTGRSTISQASRAGVIFQVPHPSPPPPPPPLLLCTNPSPVKHSRWRHRKLYLLSRAAPK